MSVFQMREIVILGKRAVRERGGDHLGCSRSYKYNATVCKMNQVDTALHFGMGHCVTDRQTDIIEAIAHTAKTLNYTCHLHCDTK